MKEAISRKKVAHKAMCGNFTDEHKKRYKNKNIAVSKAITEKFEEALAKLKNCQNCMLSLVKGQTIDSK